MTENNDIRTVPYATIEVVMDKEDKIHNRDFWIKMILIVALIVSNFLWIRYENSFKDVVTATQEITQDSCDGGTNTYNGDFIGGDYIGETDN